MKKTTLLFLAFASLSQSRADEGMWLLPLLEQQNAEMMKERGLELELTDIYNPDTVSLKDAVVKFGRGCTGEVISPEGLVLTNHHCGYSYIQNHSSVDNDLLSDGFWAMSKDQELPNEGLTVSFIDKIEDVTDYVTAELEADTTKTEMSFLSPAYLDNLAYKKISMEWLDANPGTEVEIKPFYNGNKYYMFIKKVYSDVRLVGTPPSSIGKFGADTDNWMWPRHTGDFSLFRIYADKDGNPAGYSPENIPLKVKKFFNISLKGVQKNDFAMQMGFPGRTNHFYSASEVEDRRDCENDVRVKVREVRQNVMLDAMLRDPKTKIQYASKYASSTNSYKSSKGMNKMINILDVVGQKRREEQNLIDWARKNNHPEYIAATDTVNSIVARRSRLKYRSQMLTECFYFGIECANVPTNHALLEVALEDGDKAQVEAEMLKLKEKFNRWHDKNYSPSLDRDITTAILTYYINNVEKDETPEFASVIRTKYKGNIEAYVNNLFRRSIFASKDNFNRFVKRPRLSVLQNDPMILFARSITQERIKVEYLLSEMSEEYNLAKKCYVKGLMEMYQGKPMYPDANLTLRLTYGNISPLHASDAVNYDFCTTMDGIMEKEDSLNWEFVVPCKLKQLYKNQDFGDYSMKPADDSLQVKMPVCFIVNTHTTGGNSGSPCINAHGELIGTNFDRNWEGISGDIQFQSRYQRSLCVDIRYTLFIIEKFGGARHLIDEMVIIK